MDAGAREELDFAALGYTVHNLYCLIEHYALRIAKAFENDIDPERVLLLQKRLPEIVSGFRAAHDIFMEKFDHMVVTIQKLNTQPGGGIKSCGRVVNVME